MHEMSVAMSLVEMVEESIRESGASRVSAVNIDIGSLAGVDPDSLEFCYEACSKNTPLEGSRLNINRIDAIGFCAICDKESSIAGNYSICDECMGPVKLLTGEEMEVVSVEVE